MTGLHGRPTAAELVEAVREFLEDPRLRELPPQPFQLRVAINALRIAERELAAEDPPPAGVRLSLGGEARLAARIRAGLLGEVRWRVVTAELRADVEARLAVANPDYVAGYEPDTFEDD